MSSWIRPSFKYETHLFEREQCHLRILDGSWWRVWTTRAFCSHFWTARFTVLHLFYIGIAERQLFATVQSSDFFSDVLCHFFWRRNFVTIRFAIAPQGETYLVWVWAWMPMPQRTASLSAPSPLLWSWLKTMAKWDFHKDDNDDAWQADLTPNRERCVSKLHKPCWIRNRNCLTPYECIQVKNLQIEMVVKAINHRVQFNQLASNQSEQTCEGDGERKKLHNLFGKWEALFFLHF